MKVYALYKNDTLLDIGTIKELSEKFKIKENTIRYYGTPTYKNRGKKNYRILIEVK